MEKLITKQVLLRHLGLLFDCDLGAGGRKLLTLLFIFRGDFVESALSIRHKGFLEMHPHLFTPSFSYW
jgi:hypothetical protein